MLSGRYLNSLLFWLSVTGWLRFQPNSSVQLLEVTLDQHLTFRAQSDNMSKIYHRILGAIAQVSSTLTIELRKTAYVALVRSHLDYCNVVFATASLTQLKKLNVVQKIAAWIIIGAYKTAHWAPQLQTLQILYTHHFSSLATSMLASEITILAPGSSWIANHDSLP